LFIAILQQQALRSPFDVSSSSDPSGGCRRAQSHQGPLALHALARKLPFEVGCPRAQAGDLDQHEFQVLEQSAPPAFESEQVFNRLQVGGG